ncbi:unnamed protein product [Candida verbasci]|uniref:Thioredoxin domain-containing protein n=1 Tax=Candida verbasci TaxID=1227364 RepID=A0A9W4TQA9_9ASCO|nr:unnamed protein product [Candida verbasci]
MITRSVIRSSIGSVNRVSNKQFTISTRYLQKLKNEKNEQPEKPKKRPLSRVAIGGTSSDSKYASKSQGLEFATWKAITLLIIGGGLGTYFFQKEKEKIQKYKEMEANKPVGKPLVGGPFHLVDTNGNDFTEQNLKDPQGKRFSILYFGFTHCPDVCPEELDKLGDMVNHLNEHGVDLQPIFITCDPARDSKEAIDLYLKDFHPKIIGLTGTYDEVKNTCKKYRVYFSTPPNVKSGQDYLVDHSIFFYVIDPEGNFTNVIGRESSAIEGAEKIIKDSENFIPESQRIEKKQGIFGFLYK